MRPIEIIIPRIPVSKNDTWKMVAGHKIRVKGIKHMNPWQYKRYRDGWEYDIKAALARKGVFALDREKVKKLVEIIQYRPGILDDDNLVVSIGPILDCLKRLNIIWDDAPPWLDRWSVQHRDENKRTIIRVSEI